MYSSRPGTIYLTNLTVLILLILYLNVQALDEFATKLIQNNHYAKEDVATRRDAVSGD